MRKNKFLTSIVVDIFYVDDLKNVRVDSYDDHLGFFIEWSFGGRSFSKYIDLCNIKYVLGVLQERFDDNCPAVQAWKNIYDECCKIKEHHDENK